MFIKDFTFNTRYSLAPDSSPAEILNLFIRSQEKHLPIVADTKLHGVCDFFLFLKGKEREDIHRGECMLDHYVSVQPEDSAGKFVSVDQSVLPVVGEGGLYQGYVRTRDILSRLVLSDNSSAYLAEYYKQLEEEYRAIFEYSYDGIFISDGKGNVVRINKACEAMEGIDSGEVVGKNVRQLLEEGYYNNSVTLEVLKKKIPVTQLQRAKNGRRLMCTGVPIFKNGEIVRVVINSRDISELTLLEKELQETRIQSEKLKSQVELLEKEIPHDDHLVFKSSIMHEIMNTLLHVAEFDSTLLVTGESGVGKEMIARFVHRKSKRRNAPFIKVDCGAIPTALFESELFGYDKGAFTGAERTGKRGLLELADGGTVFFDEIGELPLALQVKLLRFMQDKEIVKVGGKETIPVNTRIIAATNRDLAGMVESGRFRKDLYYRLNVIPLVVPPLRDRREDVFVLIHFFLHKFNTQFGFKRELDKESLEILEEYSWPGNVRELENLMERIIVLSHEHMIGVDDLPRGLREEYSTKKLLTGAAPGETYRETLLRVEKELLINAAGDSRNLREMAEKLGLDKSTVSRKLKKYGISLYDKSEKAETV